MARPHSTGEQNFNAAKIARFRLAAIALHQNHGKADVVVSR
jgi:hypothetical protein